MTETSRATGIAVPVAALDADPVAVTGHLHAATQRQLLVEALELAGVQVGPYDAKIVEWLAHWDASTVLPVISWLRQAARRDEARR